MLSAPKQEVLQYLDQMDESNITRVLFYVKSLSAQQKSPKSPYGKFATAEEYTKAKELWNEFEEMQKEISANCEPLPEDFDYKQVAREARWRKYESLN